jgi:curved DNA-binding protein CbpA
MPSQILDPVARAAIKAWIEQQFAELDRSSYYHLLAVERTATEEQIRDGYYRLVARLHPDLYGDHVLDPPTRQKLVSLYSRVVEGYRVLSEGRRREQYDAGLAAGKLRWSAEDERSPKRDPESEVANPNARRFFKMGRAAVLAGDAKSALMNLKLALSVEPESAVIKAEITRAEALLKGPK